MSQDHLADDLNRHSRSGGVGRGVSPQIVRSQMDPNNPSSLVYNPSAGCIGYWKNSFVRLNPFAGDVFSKAIGNLLGDENNLTLFATLWASEGKFPVFDISRGQLQNLTNSHPTSGHQFKNQPVPGFDGTKDGLIHYFLFQNIPAGESWGSIELFQHRSTARASEIGIEVLSDEIEERGQLGIPSPFGCLFGVLIDLSEEREDFFRA